MPCEGVVIHLIGGLFQVVNFSGRAKGNGVEWPVKEGCNPYSLSVRDVSCDMWDVSCDVWDVSCDVWDMSCDVMIMSGDVRMI